MKHKFSERLSALCLSLVTLLSCCTPYGFAAETDGDSLTTLEAATDAETVETEEPNDAEAI